MKTKKWMLMGLLLWSSQMYIGAAQPDSVYIMPYATAHDQGRSGLRFLWSQDGTDWHDLAGGAALVRCDFNPVKRIYKPYLTGNAGDNVLHLFWNLDEEGTAMAYTSTPDLISWKPQDFFDKAELSRYQDAGERKAVPETVRWGEGTIEGYALKIPYQMIEHLEQYRDYRAYKGMFHGERAEHDQTRFATLDTVKARIKVTGEQAYPISENLIGVFFEDLNYAADGGLYAELVQNRDFEYSASDGNRDKNWNSRYAWQIDGEGMSMDIATDQPLHQNNPHYAVLKVVQPGASLVNGGFDGMAVKKGEKYDFSVFARNMEGKGKSKWNVQLVGPDGTVLASSRLTVSSSDWKKCGLTLTSKADEPKARLVIQPLTSGSYALDMISLFPQKTFKGRQNGLRADLAQAIADIHPRFVRFPGGCLAHGDGLDNIYHWKETIGPLEARKPAPNIWRYHQTRGLGYFEYFQFCEDIGAEPLPVVAAGVPCQNSTRKSRFSRDLVTTHGQQGGIPMDEMDQYVQDVLDLIEYANGDPRTTRWGRERAKAGHPEPFNLKYIGLGNEDLITRVFKERFRMIYDAVKKHYPDITVIGTSGPFCEGADYDEGWKFADELDLPMVDEHNYNSPGWFIYNQDYYDRYDRTKSKVYLGEYAAHAPGRVNNMETALSTALFLTSVERNGDVVSMTSYAPLLAKDGYTQWRPDLIYFTNTEVRLTTDYYVQQMFGQNSGSDYLPSELTLEGRYGQNVHKRIAVSVVKDKKSGDVILKLVNMLPVSVKAGLDMAFLADRSSDAEVTVLSGKPDETAVSPSVTTTTVSRDFQYEMSPYSFTVIRVKP